MRSSRRNAEAENAGRLPILGSWVVLRRCTDIDRKAVLGANGASRTEPANPASDGVIMSLTVTELAEEVRESNKRLTEAIQDLRTEFREMRKDFFDLRGEVGKINTNLESFKTRVETNLGFIRWIGVFLATCGIGVLGFSYTRGPASHSNRRRGRRAAERRRGAPERLESKRRPVCQGARIPGPDREGNGPSAHGQEAGTRLIGAAEDRSRLNLGMPRAGHKPASSGCPCRALMNNEATPATVALAIR